MVYSKIADLTKTTLHYGIDYVVPQNGFIASATAFAGWFGYQWGMTYSQNYIHLFIMEQMGCSNTTHSIKSIVTDITETVGKNFLSSVGTVAAGFFDSFTGSSTTSWIVDTVGNVTGDTALIEKCSQGIRCVGADMVTPIITPELAPYIAKYYYSLGAMVVTSITLNLIALASFKLYSLGKSCCKSSSEELESLYDPPPQLASNMQPVKQPNPQDLQLLVIEEKLQKFEEDQLKRHNSLILSFQEKYEGIKSTLEVVTTPIFETVKKIENTVSVQGATLNEITFERENFQPLHRRRPYIRRVKEPESCFSFLFFWTKICPNVQPEEN